ncbi:hypothetical protein ACFXTI_005546 [Malus domestica]
MKIVVKVPMYCDKCRTKALKIAAAAQGMVAGSLKQCSCNMEEEDEDRIVIGDDVDSVCLTRSLRKKLGCSCTIVEVEKVKPVEPKIIIRQHVDCWIEEDKNTLEVHTLAKLQKLSKHFFSLNSNFGIGGVSKVSLEVEKEKVEAIRNGVDAVCLAKSLKNKLGFTTVVSVEEVKNGEEKPAEPIQLASSYIHYPHYPAVQYYYDGLGTFT